MKKKDWYSPHSVESRYSKPQIKWLMPHLTLLRVGIYPRNPKETGYTDPAISKAPIKASASFEVPARIAAELDLRIQAATTAKGFPSGMIMEFLYAFEPDDEITTIEHMAQCMNLGVREVAQHIWNALCFVSGPERKTGGYAQYVRDNHRYLRLK